MIRVEGPKNKKIERGEDLGYIAMVMMWLSIWRYIDLRQTRNVDR